VSRFPFIVGRMLLRHWLIAFASLSLVACQGVIGEAEDPDWGLDIPDDDPRNPEDPEEHPEDPGIVEPPPDACTGPVDVPEVPLRRLTRTQLDLSVLDLLDDPSAPGQTLPPDDDNEGFHVGGVATSLLVEQIAAAAEAIAAEAAGKVEGWLACEAANATCAATMIEVVGRRAWRRPLDDAELAQLMDVWNVGAEGEGFRGGARLVLQAIVESPFFLYHVELAPEDASEGQVVPVEDYALASRLSYFLWGSLPDDALLDAAASGALRTPEGLRAEAERLLDDETRGTRGFVSFLNQWLKLAPLATAVKDPERYPEFDAQVAADLQRSLERLAEDALREGDFEALLTTSDAWVNARLAPLYGLDPSTFGDELERVSVDPAQRAGIVTHPAVMALYAKGNQSDPIHRAVLVRERFLCQHLEAPPEGLAVVAPDPEPGLSTRDRFAEHSSNPVCAGCHRLLDPVGFGFEHYDAVGAWRDDEDGVPVDASGAMHETQGMDGDFDDAVDLAHRMADAPEVQRCFSRQVFRFALQRVERDEVDDCSMKQIDDAFADSDYSLRELLLAIVTSDAFRHQRVQ